MSNGLELSDKEIEAKLNEWDKRYKEFIEESVISEKQRLLNKLKSRIEISIKDGLSYRKISDMILKIYGKNISAGMIGEFARKEGIASKKKVLTKSIPSKKNREKENSVSTDRKNAEFEIS